MVQKASIWKNANGEQIGGQCLIERLQPYDSREETRPRTRWTNDDVIHSNRNRNTLASNSYNMILLHCWHLTWRSMLVPQAWSNMDAESERPLKGVVFPDRVVRKLRRDGFVRGHLHVAKELVLTWNKRFPVRNSESVQAWAKETDRMAYSLPGQWFPNN